MCSFHRHVYHQFTEEDVLREMKVHNKPREWAERMLRNTSPDDRRNVQKQFDSILRQEPDPEELEAMRAKKAKGRAK